MHSGDTPRTWYYPKPLCGMGGFEWMLIGLGSLIAYLLESPFGGWP
jgi:hypothetical protein